MRFPADIVNAIGLPPSLTTSERACLPVAAQAAALSLPHWPCRHGPGALGYFLVPKSTRGVSRSCAAMSKVAIGCAEEYISERQIRPGKVVSSVL